MKTIILLFLTILNLSSVFATESTSAAEIEFQIIEYGEKWRYVDFYDDPSIKEIAKDSAKKRGVAEAKSKAKRLNCDLKTMEQVSRWRFESKFIRRCPGYMDGYCWQRFVAHTTFRCIAD